MWQKARKVILIFLLLPGSLLHAQTILPPTVVSALAIRDIPQETVSVYVEDLDTRKVLLDFNSDAPRNPASTIKLLTTLAALDTLGPAYKWKTEIYLLGPLKDGVVDGDILIKGYGDPYLITERFWGMLRELRQHGVRKINGDLVIDDGYFDVPDSDPGAFDGAPLRAYNVTPNALLMNFKMVHYHFSTEAGSDEVALRVDPQLSNLQVINKLGVVNGSCRGYQRGITISANDSVDRIEFSGDFPSRCRDYSMGRAVLDHNSYAYGLFAALWSEVGGEFTGNWRAGKAAEDAEPFIIFDSLPLGDIISLVNKHSNNVMARQLLYTMGAESGVLPATENAGRLAVFGWLKSHAIDAPELVLVNGAGLSRQSRISARHMGDLLRVGYRSSFMPEFLSSLSLSGLDGTMARRFRHDSLTGMAHVKTGSLDDVSGLAGYLQTRSGRRLSVVVMLNYTDVHRGPGEEVQAALLKWLYAQ